MKKILNLLLLLSSFFGYLEWGKGQHRYIFELEYELFFTLPHKLTNLSHPLILLPLLGQVLLFYTLLQKTPGKKITYIGMICIGILMLLLLFIGIMEKNGQIMAGAAPFILISVIILFYHRSEKKRHHSHEKI